MKKIIGLMGLVTICFAATASAYECATVKIEIQQELTLERQAFQAQMTINNGFANLNLTNVTVSLVFTDKDGKLVTHTSDTNIPSVFFAQTPVVQNAESEPGGGQRNEA
jgi:hypothetical protein